MNGKEIDFFNWAESNGFSRRPGRFGALQSEAHQLNTMAKRAVAKLAGISDYERIEVLQVALAHCSERFGASGTAWQKLSYSFAAEMNSELKRSAETKDLAVEPRGGEWRLNQRTAGGGVRMIGTVAL